MSMIFITHSINRFDWGEERGGGGMGRTSLLFAVMICEDVELQIFHCYKSYTLHSPEKKIKKKIQKNYY